MPKPLDLTGQRFGSLTVLRKDGHDGLVVVWACECDCGTEVRVRALNLRKGNTRSCGCVGRVPGSRPDVRDLVGQTFARWTVLQQTNERSSNGGAVWLCRCECGTERAVRSDRLTHGVSLSCGCQRVDSAIETWTTHGMTGTSDYNRWGQIKDRCTNPKNRRFPDYGGRGIKMHPAWFASFEAYFADVGPRPSPELLLDRINNDGNYEPGNVRWATRSEQQRNRGRLRDYRTQVTQPVPSV